MRRNRTPQRPGRRVLFLIGILFFASGLLRLADGTGLAVAREIEALGGHGVANAQTHAGDGTQEQVRTAEFSAELRALRERSAALDEREVLIERRLAALRQAEEKIATEMAALVAAEESLAATLSLADGAAEADIARLTAVYERMKPKEAAEVFDAMDPTFAAGFLARMRHDTAADILAGLPPAKAYTVSVILAGRNVGVPTQ